jgi:DNA-binding beta-propeller fold protein YncE
LESIISLEKRLNSAANDKINNNMLLSTKLLFVLVINSWKASSTNTAVGIPVGSNPYGITYDPDNGNIYVTNVYSDFVSVIATITTVQPPTHTTITSAVHGNGAAVSNGGSTVSTSITFTVSTDYHLETLTQKAAGLD